MKTRRHIGLLLTTVLVLGTVVSPVVHYSWMALGGHFDALLTHDNASHGTSTLDPSSHSALPSGTQATTDDLEHLTCDYSNLFGTFTACPTPEPVHVTPGVRPNERVTFASLVDAVASIDSIQLRGPPAV